MNGVILLLVGEEFEIWLVMVMVFEWLFLVFDV